MSQTTEVLIDRLIEQSGENAVNRRRAEFLEHTGILDTAEISKLKAEVATLASDNTRTNELERMLRELSDAAEPAMKKLRVGSEARVRLSKAIFAVNTHIIPF